MDYYTHDTLVNINHGSDYTEIRLSICAENLDENSTREQIEEAIDRELDQARRQLEVDFDDRDGLVEDIQEQINNSRLTHLIRTEATGIVKITTAREAGKTARGCEGYRFSFYEVKLLELDEAKEL